MKTLFFHTVVAICLIATLNSCSKDEQANSTPAKASGEPPDDYGYIELGDGELYWPKEGLTTYAQVKEKFLLVSTPLNLEKYKNGTLLDSACNQDIALRFNSKGRKTHDKSVAWGVKPDVAEEYAPIITFNIKNSVTIKFSKMVNAFSFEMNSPYKDVEYGLHVTFYNSKLNTPINHTSYVTYLHSDTTFGPALGWPKGALFSAVDSPAPFDELVIFFEYVEYGAPPPPGPFDLSLSGFRYRLAK
ncbi:MAG: hypothetical protein JWQ28_599 [Pedobacter sp.]|nr:hypothetical protein [Pedobacter sp.]